MNIFWTSDWHLNHLNIIKYCNRPFSNLEEMNSTIINRFNERVNSDDMCFYLGDFIFKSGSNRGEGEPDKAMTFRNQLNCRQMIFIEGNHDAKGKNSLRTPIRKIIIRYGGKDICMVHSPDHIDWNYSFHICGHVHEKWDFKEFQRNGKRIHCCNVSVERWKYYPITWDEINQAYSSWLKGRKNETIN